MKQKLFISYSRVDQDETNWLERLKMYLSTISRAKEIEVWDDSQIAAGKLWLKEIEQALARTQVAILIVGPGFLASDFVMEKEVPELLSAAVQRGTKIIPLIVGFCSYTESSLGAHQAFNDANKPLESLPKHEQNRILSEVATEIHKSLQQKAKRKENDQLETKEIIREVAINLRVTLKAFYAQRRRRDDLVLMIEERLGIQRNLEFEKFFFRYFSQLDEAERFEFDQIRAITEGTLYPGNIRLLELIDQNPQVVNEISILADVRTHLVFWLNKYERVFTANRAMCLLYAGVEDAVPFPSGVDEATEEWLLKHK